MSGSLIAFNATIKSIGSLTQTRHFHGISIKKMPGFLNLPPHIHEGGRYDDKPRLIRKD